MKVVIILLALSTFIYGCSNETDGRDFSGCYITHFKNEYAETDDTLTVTKAGGQGNNYEIERHSGFQKIRDGKLKDKEFKTIRWNATYDPKTSLLQESDLGKQIQVIADKNVLRLGDSNYIKLK